MVKVMINLLEYVKLVYYLGFFSNCLVDFVNFRMRECKNKWKILLCFEILIDFVIVINVDV